MASGVSLNKSRKGTYVLPPTSLVLSRQVQLRAIKAQQQRDELANQARRSHDEYWNRTCPGKYFEHERYSQDWDVGFSDALSFFVMRADGGLGDRAGEGGDRIGCIDVYVKSDCWSQGKEVLLFGSGNRDSGLE